MSGVVQLVEIWSGWRVECGTRCSYLCDLTTAAPLICLGEQVTDSRFP